MSTYQLKIGFVYILLIAGGCWHVFGLFQSAMQMLASFMIALLCLWQVWEYLRFQNDSMKKIYFLIWCLSVYTVSFIVEWIGIVTGQVFGYYEYTTILQPVIFHVPLVIGLAWLGVLIASAAIARYILGSFFRYRWLAAILSAFLMTLFDFFMEPAAVKLNYWEWLSPSIPLRNYYAWFWVSLILVIPALYAKLFEEKLPTLIIHIYIAQLLYFLIVYAA